MADELEVVPTHWYTAEVRALPEEGRTRVDRRLLNFARKGWTASLGDATVKHLRDGIHELRVVGRGAAYRVLFFLAPGRSPRMVVLTTCAAKSDLKKRPRMDAELERASERRAQWIEQQKRTEDDDARR
jgi:putative component of toxin-antitoxin plasmid stabilization module